VLRALGVLRMLPVFAAARRCLRFLVHLVITNFDLPLNVN